METITCNPAFSSPCGIHIVGPTMSGKSTLSRRLIANSLVLSTPPPDRIVYCYEAGKKNFEDMSNCKFDKGLAAVLQDGYFDPIVNSMVVLDDLMEEVCENKNAAATFTRGIQHKNLTVLFLDQNLYKQSKAMRDVALSSQYLILFESVQDVQQVKVLARQIIFAHLEPAYQKAIKEPFRY